MTGAFFIRHARATDVRHFGPFPTLADVARFLGEHPDVHGVVLPMTTEVDWTQSDADVLEALSAAALERAAEELGIHDARGPLCPYPESGCNGCDDDPGARSALTAEIRRA